MYQNLRELRLKNKIPINVFLKELGLETKSAYYKKETGLVPITLEEAKKIADILGLSIEAIFFV